MSLGGACKEWETEPSLHLHALPVPVSHPVLISPHLLIHMQ